MEKLPIFPLLILFAAIMAGCGQTSEGGGLSLVSFSWEEESAQYQPVDAGVNPYAFHNTMPVQIDGQTDAAECAKKECTIEYTNVSVYYDSSADMWRVDFFTAERDGQGVIAFVGDCQSIYLDGDGITRLIVYGE